MIKVFKYDYEPSEHEAERASNSYLMSIVAIIAGLPLPIINLIASIVFYFSNQKSTSFVKWHCTQALISQLSFFCFNSFGFWWTISIITDYRTISNEYIAYILVLIVFNFIEIIATIYTASATRKGIHVQWFLYGNITNLILNQKS